MKVTPLALPEVLLIEPRVHRDARGFFMESFNQQRFHEATGVQSEFVQDSHSRSVRGVLRGLHYQIRQPQGKLVRVVRGEVFDVVVDLRRSSSSFGKWVGGVLSEERQQQLWIPPGFAHGFLVLSASADFVYKVTEYYAPLHERAVAWDDPQLSIKWPSLGCVPLLSAKDAQALPLAQSEVFD